MLPSDTRKLVSYDISQRALRDTCPRQKSVQEKQLLFTRRSNYGGFIVCDTLHAFPLGWIVIGFQCIFSR